MLHELAHNVHGPHDAKFHALWNQLRDENFSLSLKGYTGEGFLSDGHRLGGGTTPMDEARRLARAAAENRRTLGSGSGQRLGGATPRPGQDIRNVITNAVERRNQTLRGCANDNQTQDEIIEIADTATRNGFRTKAEEDAANDAAIAQALWEIVEEEETAKKGGAYVPLGATGNASRNSPAQPSTVRPGVRSDKEASGTRSSNTWTCGVCTLNNPASYLCCDACGTERNERSAAPQQAVIDLTGPDRGASNKRAQHTSTTSAAKGKESRQAPSPATAPASRMWTCHFCGRVRESQWWSCDLCGTIKLASN